LDNKYHFIARGILKNKHQIEVPDKAENRTRTGGTETKKQKQRQIGRKRRPRTMTLKRDYYQV